jgi:hypothetical protein
VAIPSRTIRHNTIDEIEKRLEPQSIRDQALENAALVCDALYDKWKNANGFEGATVGAGKCGDDIRALKAKPS